MYKKKAKEIIKIGMELFIVYIFLQAGMYISNFLKGFISLPASIVGMILLLIFLSTNILHISKIEKSGKFLLKNMGFFFIPLGVGLINSVDLLKEFWKELIIIIVLSGSLVMIVSAKVTDMLINFLSKKDGEIL